MVLGKGPVKPLHGPGESHESDASFFLDIATPVWQQPIHHADHKDQGKLTVTSKSEQRVEGSQVECEPIPDERAQVVL